MATTDRYTYWTAEEEDTLRQLVAEHLDPIDIAKKLNRRYGSVLSRMSRLRLHSLSPQNVRLWTEEEDATIVRLRNQGMGLKEICQVVNRTFYATQHRYSKIKSKRIAPRHRLRKAGN